MSYSWDNVSKADISTNFLGFGEIGGVGQLVYHHIRFSDYIWVSRDDPEFPAQPVINEKSPPDMNPKGGMTGKDILISLCNLARRIDDFDEPTPCYDLIIGWCREHMHPYRIDYLYRALNDKAFDIASIDADLLARDATFTVAQFMKDLEQLYNAARLYIAMEALCIADNSPAYNLYHEGRHFESDSIFERYKRNDEIPDIDVSAAKDNLLEEMKLYNEYREAHTELQPPDGVFAREPYDDFEQLQERLIDYIPDFRLRLKRNTKTNTLVFAADVDSVFDIAWYTLARMLSEDPPLEQKGFTEQRPEGIMIRCHNCGRFFIRSKRSQQYCDLPECQKARNAKNQREFRRRQANKRVKAALKGKGQ